MSDNFRQTVTPILCDQRCSPHKIANCIYMEAGKCCPVIQSPLDRICEAVLKMAEGMPKAPETSRGCKTPYDFGQHEGMKALYKAQKAYWRKQVE